jgi:hypothetical protein
VDPEAEQLLSDGLAAAGASGGRTGAVIGGGMGAGYGGARGGALGARLAARLLRTRTFEETAELELAPAAAAEVFSDVIEHHGRMVRGERDGSRATLRGVVGAGGLDLNPAVVDVVLEPRRGGGSLATVHAAAKEGLIPQRTAPKAVRKLLESYGVATRAPAGLDGYSAAPPS